MRKILMAIILALLVATGLTAQTAPTSPSFKLLEADEYKVDIFYSTQQQRLYIQVDFSIPRDSLTEDYYGFFLPRDMDYQTLTAGGKYQTRWLVNNLVPESFDPPLANPAILDADSPALFNAFKLANLGTLPDPVPFRLWFNVAAPPFTLGPEQKLSSIIPASHFWYPRNLNRQCKVNVVMTSAPYITLLIGNNFAYSTEDGFFRTHRATYLETVEQPCSLFLVRD